MLMEHQSNKRKSRIIKGSDPLRMKFGVTLQGKQPKSREVMALGRETELCQLQPYNKMWTPKMW